MLLAYHSRITAPPPKEFAAIVKSARVTARMQTIIRESQQQAEELKAQEEEIRQSMEESPNGRNKTLATPVNL